MSKESKLLRARPLASLLTACLGVAAAVTWACDPSTPADDEGTDPETQAERQDVLASVANGVVVPTLEELEARSGAMRSAADGLAATPDDADALAAAQEAWHALWWQWQQVEAMQIGALGPAGKTPAGASLRDELYSWPTVNACTIDRRVADEGYTDPDFFRDQLVLAYGLDALEYLLFAHDEDHRCPSQIQLDPAWSALSFAQIEARRAAYAAALSARIETQAGELRGLWTDGGFAAQLAAPGEGDSPYRNVDEAMDAVFRAMFYVELITKDAKIGRPLGFIEGSCASPPCLDQLEAPWSGAEIAAIESNLEALRRMVLGGEDGEEGTGFDDLLRSGGHDDIADGLLADIDAAIATARATQGPLRTLAVEDPGAAEALYEAVRTVTTTLKGPFSMALRLQVPAEGAGDND